MTPLKVAVGSTNPTKVRAARRAVMTLWPEAEVVAIEVPSGVSAMPLSDDEGQRGALQRARAARELTHADLGIGMEGAAGERPEALYLTNWVAVVDAAGRQSLANGGALPLPEAIAAELRAGVELGPLMDRLTGQADSKQHLGAAGYLTRGVIPRWLTFFVGVGLALAPFARPELYRTLEQTA